MDARLGWPRKKHTRALAGAVSPNEGTEVAFKSKPISRQIWPRGQNDGQRRMPIDKLTGQFAMRPTILCLSSSGRLCTSAGRHKEKSTRHEPDFEIHMDPSLDFWLSSAAVFSPRDVGASRRKELDMVSDNLDAGIRRSRLPSSMDLTTMLSWAQRVSGKESKNRLSCLGKLERTREPLDCWVWLQGRDNWLSAWLLDTSKNTEECGRPYRASRVFPKYN